MSILVAKYLTYENATWTLESVKEARAQGDLSENFEYYAAKREKNKNESRIRYLERMLKNAVIVEDNSSSDEVGLNKTVTVYIEEDDESEELVDFSDVDYEDDVLDDNDQENNNSSVTKTHLGDDSKRIVDDASQQKENFQGSVIV